MDDVREWGIAALHRASEGLTCTTAVHICYGYGIKANNDWKASLGSEWRQYEAIFPALAASRIDQVSLECANSRVPAELMALLSGKDVLVGAIMRKIAGLASTLRRAMKFIAGKDTLPIYGVTPLDRGTRGSLAAGGEKPVRAGWRDRDRKLVRLPGTVNSSR
jgi:5-methyltetrahydropteroyltriglutamate--homocysteine methyltransferase